MNADNRYEHHDDTGDGDDSGPFFLPSTETAATLRRGEEANLAVYRAALKAWSDLKVQSSSSSNDANALQSAKEAVDDASKQLLRNDATATNINEQQQQEVTRGAEYFLLNRLEAKLCIQQQEDEEQDDDDDDGNGQVQEQASQPNVSMIPGYILVTSERLLFCAKEAPDGAVADLDIAATRIDLHALSSLGGESSNDTSHENNDETTNTSSGELHHPPAPVSAVYVQVQSEESGDDDYNSPAPLEITIVPQQQRGENETTLPQKCQEVFDAIAQLVSLHPIDPNEGEGGDEQGNNNNHGLSAMMMLMMNGGGAENDNGGGGGCYSDNDEMVWAPSTTTAATTATSGDATEDERQAMLERLDNLLVVPPELEIANDNDENENDANDANDTEQPAIPGQFDDADEEDEDNAIL